MPARILLVEDDALLRMTVRLVLEDEGNTVVEAGDAEQALRSFGECRADVVLVDITLPGMDGFELCRQLRRTDDVPILMLTARADAYDQVAGLEAGADDYVTKPVEPKVLSARIRALLRRAHPTDRLKVLQVGGLVIEPDAGTVRVDGEEVAVTRIEFELLRVMAQSAGRVLSRTALLEQVWGYDYLGDSRIVDAAVRRLRAKIEPDPHHPARLVTVRGLGYRLQA